MKLPIAVALLKPQTDKQFLFQPRNFWTSCNLDWLPKRLLCPVSTSPSKNKDSFCRLLSDTTLCADSLKLVSQQHVTDRRPFVETRLPNRGANSCLPRSALQGVLPIQRGRAIYKRQGRFRSPQLLVAVPNKRQEQSLLF